MMKIRNFNLFLAAVVLWAMNNPAIATPVQAQTKSEVADAAVRQMGTVKAVAGDTITMTTDAGAESSVRVPDSARIMRTAPGQKDLKEATPIKLQDIHPGDRMLARGKMAEDGKTLAASTVVVISSADIAQIHARELQDWRQRGVGGLVKSVDPATKTVTISTMGMAGQTKISVHATSDTAFRRYAADSVKFDDAKKSSFEEIKPGDQLRARGNHNPDNTEVTADEIVFGTFRNVAGKISATDPASRTITVNDLATKKPVTVAIGPDSQMRQLPPMMAQRIAMRLKGGAAVTAGGQALPAGQRSPEAARGYGGFVGSGGPGSAGGPGGPRGDLQEMLSRLPVVTLADIQKGDVVMMVATEGSANSSPAAVTLLTGVEPILTASPKGDGQAGALLSPWNLGTGAAEAGAAQ